VNELARDLGKPAALPAPVTATSIVPDLIGLDLAEALTTAAWAGTSVNATRVVRARGPWGVIIAQSPSPGTHLKRLWRIHVLVSEPSPAGDDHDV
jgi:beta-lactam-binding protein with PASTA domain